MSAPTSPADDGARQPRAAAAPTTPPSGREPPAAGAPTSPADDGARQRRAAAAPTSSPSACEPPAAAAPTTAGGARVWFIGAGPGAPDLLTLRAARVIAAADVVVWAASLVMAETVTAHTRPDAEVLDSSGLTLEQVCAVYDRAAAEGRSVARVHSGDPSLYGAIGEQIAYCEERGIPWEIVPGVSSLSAAAAAAGRELTVPEVAQSVILTRLPTATPMPAGEDVRAFAAHGTTMALFLSAKRGKRLQAELLAGGYAPATPCVVVYRASWPEEQVHRCRLDELAATLRAARLTRHTLVLVGPALGAAGTRSRLYDPAFAHACRPGGPW